MSEHFYYPVGRGSRWDDQELRYSLRSLEKHTKDPEVTIVGHAPAWLNLGKVQYIPLPEPKGNRLFRVGAKLIAALPYLPDSFIYQNDDYFLMEPIESFDTIYIGTLRQTIAELMNIGHFSVHIKGQQDTLEALLDYTSEPLDYDAHAPMPMMRDLVLQCATVFPFWNDMQLKCIYGNYLQIGGVQGPNGKGAKWHGWKYFSTEEYPTEEVKKLLQSTFPEPSRFERR